MSKKHCTKICLKTGVCDSLICGNTLAVPTVGAQQIDTAINQLVESAWAKKAITPFPKWISAEDRLPEQVGDYLIHIASEDWCDSYMMTSQFFEGRFVDAIGCAPVTHWMPLPPAPLNEVKE